MYMTRTTMKEQMQNERNHKGEGAKPDKKGKSRFRTT
jgi:hypothetical protein